MSIWNNSPIFSPTHENRYTLTQKKGYRKEPIALLINLNLHYLVPAKKVHLVTTHFSDQTLKNSNYLTLKTLNMSTTPSPSTLTKYIPGLATEISTSPIVLRCSSTTLPVTSITDIV